MDIRNFNVLLITLDSLPYSVAKNVNDLYLNTIGNLREAETHGTYTYPAHHSFFLGILPRLTDPNQLYLGKYKQIWRSSLSRKSNNIVSISFDDKNILNYYKNNGFQVVGFGGVLFFDTTSKSNSLPQLFDKFTFFGPYEKYDHRPFPRKKEWFPLNHLEKISSSIKKEPYFLFINSNATHVPYDNPKSTITATDKEMMTRLFSEHSKKTIHPQNKLPFSEQEHKRLVELQSESLIWADKQIEKLLDMLPRARPTIFIVCGDHGEEFGEGGRYGHAHSHSSVMTVPYWDAILEANKS